MFRFVSRFTHDIKLCIASSVFFFETQSCFPLVTYFYSGSFHAQCRLLHRKICLKYLTSRSALSFHFSVGFFLVKWDVLSAFGYIPCSSHEFITLVSGNGTFHSHNTNNFFVTSRILQFYSVFFIHIWVISTTFVAYPT